MIAATTWLIILGYLATSAWLWPRFALESYKRESARYSTLEASKAGCASVAVIHALVWPAVLAARHAGKYIDKQLQAEKSRAEQEKQMAAEIKKYRAIESLRPQLEILAFEKAIITTADEARRHNRKVDGIANSLHLDGDFRRADIAALFHPYRVTGNPEVEQP